MGFGGFVGLGWVGVLSRQVWVFDGASTFFGFWVSRGFWMLFGREDLTGCFAVFGFWVCKSSIVYCLCT